MVLDNPRQHHSEGKGLLVLHEPCSLWLLSSMSFSFHGEFLPYFCNPPRTVYKKKTDTQTNNLRNKYGPLAGVGFIFVEAKFTILMHLNTSCFIFFLGIHVWFNNSLLNYSNVRTLHVQSVVDSFESCRVEC